MSDPRVIVYSTSWCSWCHRAKALLRGQGVAFQEIDGEKEWGNHFRDEIEARTGARTVPQVVIDGRPIGGFEEHEALAAAGGLETLK